MLVVSIPKPFAPGMTAKCKVNGEATTLTWKEPDLVVLGQGDERVILRVNISDTLVHFTCGGSGDKPSDWGYEQGVLFYQGDKP